MFIHRIKANLRGHVQPIHFNFQQGANQFQNQIVYQGKKEHAEILRQALETIFDQKSNPQILNAELSLSDSDGVSWILHTSGTKLEIFANSRPATLADLKASLGLRSEAQLFEEKSFYYDNLSELFVPLDEIDLQTHPIYMSVQDHFLQLASRLKFHLSSQNILSFERCESFFAQAIPLAQTYEALSQTIQDGHLDAGFDENSAKTFFTQTLQEIELIQSIEAIVSRIMDLSSLEPSSEQKTLDLEKSILAARQNFDTPKIQTLLKDGPIETLVVSVVQYKGLSHLLQIVTSGRNQLDLEQRQLRAVLEPLTKLAERIEREISNLKVDIVRIETAMGQKILTMDQFLDWIGRYFKLQVQESQFATIVQTGIELTALTEKLRLKLTEWRQLNASQKSTLPEHRSLLVSEARAISRYKGQKSSHIIKKIQDWIRSNGAAHGRTWLKQIQNEKNISFQKVAHEHGLAFSHLQDKNFSAASALWPEFLLARKHLPLAVQNILFTDAEASSSHAETALCLFEVIKKASSQFATQQDNAGFFAKLATFTHYRQRLILVDDPTLWQQCSKLKFGQCTVDVNFLNTKFNNPVAGQVITTERKLSRHERVQQTLDILNYSKFNSGVEKSKK